MTAMADVDDLKTRSAAGGALAMLTDFEEVTSAFIDDTENKETKSLFSNPLSNPRANTNRQGQQNVDIDTFWRKRFTRDDLKVPDFLKSKQERIFDTGKYLSVVRQYGKKVFRPLRCEPLEYCTESRIYDERIDEAYKFASKELLELLLVENKLIERLYSLKRYFLFSSGDFFVQFMDMADEELSRTKDDINMTRLESLLELALRTSSCNNDPYKDDVHIKMSDGSLFQIMASINNTNGVDFDDERARAEYCHSSGNLLGWESLMLSY
ncbi:MAG: Spc97/Spc98 family protein, partial [Oxalobacteraceae bacterium]